MAFHAVFVQFYEIGYKYNDRASTSLERSAQERPHFTADDDSMVLFVLPRLLLLVTVALVGFGYLGAEKAFVYAASSLGLLVLLVMHTKLGANVGLQYSSRWITFAWLAVFKYAPSLLAVCDKSTAAMLLLYNFVLYGGGRTVDYAINKHRGIVKKNKIDIPAAWFLSTVPIALYSACAGSVINLQVICMVLVYGLYFATSAAKKHIAQHA